MASGHDHHDAFDDEPVHELPPDEPRTAGWVPALGLGFFLVALVVWLAKSTDPAAASPAPEPAPNALNAPQVAQVAAPPATAPAERSARPMPSGSGGARQLTLDQARELQKRIDEMRQRRGGGNPAAAPAPAPAPRR